MMKALRRAMAMRYRLEAAKARSDMRDWQVKRRERTRQLIELGGLVVKAELVDLTDDDRATLYGAFLDLANRLQGNDRDTALVLWKRRGKRAFDMEGEGLRKKERRQRS
ncbi:conjugative transfer protein TraD [Hephaestia caeni]|uniref:Conjugative transfer protein TraD n=2 Tax=Hephaestia caeni TaxID=645617 RepID=A0A397PEU6_9SPHN|nr:conjugative transfer protein TraD [Hephaestia caeni]